MRLTERQAKFAEKFAALGDHQIAAREAGYQATHASGYRAAESPAVYAEIVRQQTRILYADLLPAAVQCLGSIIKDPHAPTGARVNAAKIVMDRTVGASDTFAKEPHEMSADELARAIAELEKAAMSKAREVTGEVLDPNQEAGVFE